MGIAFNRHNDIYNNKYLVKRRDDEDYYDRNDDDDDDRKNDRKDDDDNRQNNGYVNDNNNQAGYDGYQNVGGMDQNDPNAIGGNNGVIVATGESAIDVDVYAQMQEQQKQQQQNEKKSVFTSDYFKYSIIGILALVILYFIIRFLLKHRKKNDLSTNFNRNYSKARDIIKNPEAESYSYDSRDEVNSEGLYRIESTDSMGQMFHTTDITNEENNKKTNNAVNVNPVMSKNMSPKISQITPAHLINSQPKSPQDDIYITSPRSLQNVHLTSSSASSFSSQESKSSPYRKSLTKASIGSSISLKPKRHSKKFVSSRSRSLSSSNYYMSSDFLMTPLVTQIIPGLDEAMPPPSEDDFVDYPPTPLPETLEDIPYSDNPDVDSEDTEVITPPLEAAKPSEEVQPVQFEKHYQQQPLQQQYQEQMQYNQQVPQQKTKKKVQSIKTSPGISQPVALQHQNSSQSPQRQKFKPKSPIHQNGRPSSPLSPKRTSSQPSSPLSQPTSPLSPKRQHSLNIASPKQQNSKPVSLVSPRQQISQNIPKRLSTKQPATPKRQDSNPTSPQRRYGEPQQIHVTNIQRNSLPPPKPQPRISSRMESVENTNQRPMVKDKKSLVNVRFEIPQNQEVSFEEEMMASFEKYNSSFNNINSSHLLYTNQQAI